MRRFPPSRALARVFLADLRVQPQVIHGSVFQLHGERGGPRQFGSVASLCFPSWFPCGFDGFLKSRNVGWRLAFVPQQIEESKHISDEE